MKGLLRVRRPSPAMVVALIALFVALSGGAAAGTYVATTRSGPTKAGALRASTALRAAVLARRIGIKPSLMLKAGKPITRGPRGPRGPRGLRGPAGGFTTANVSYVPAPVTVMCAFGAGTCAVGNSEALCPAGKMAIGGGWIGDAPDPPLSATVAYSAPTVHNGWGVVMTNNSSAATASYHAFAVCAG
jgi:hypothetical protein